MAKILAHLKKIGFFEEILTKNPLLNSAAGPPAGPPTGPPEWPQNEMLRILLRISRLRFGSALTARHEQQICQLSVEKTEALMESFLDFETLANLAAWLAVHEAPSV